MIMKKIFVLFVACIFFLCSCSFSGKQRETEQEILTQTVPELTKGTNVEQKMGVSDTVDIQQSDIIIFEKDREIMIAQGNINEVFYFLSGYKDIPVAKENIKKNWSMFSPVWRKHKRGRAMSHYHGWMAQA